MRTHPFARSRRSRAVAFCVPVCVLSLAATAPVSANPPAGSESAERPVVERLLDILLEQKSITPGQYDELLAQARREEAAAAERVAAAPPPAETAAVEAGPPAWTFKWDNGFRLEREDGAYKLRFGGRAQVDGALVFESNALSDDLRALGGDGQGDGVEIRRARIFFEGTVYERLFFKAQYDFAGGQAEFKDVYVGLREMGPLGSLQVGQFKEPFQLDEMASADNITFMERATTNAFFPDRNVGLMAMNTFADKRVLWQLGTFRNTDDFGDAFSSFDGTDWDVAARLTGLPLWADEGRRLVHLGVDYIHRFRGSSESYDQRPESQLADPFVATSDISTRGTDLVNGELAWVHGPFSFQSEYTHSLVNGHQGQANVDFWGVYAQVSFFLTGEHRPYEPDYGRFGRVRPKANFDPAEGGFGAFEVAARYSYLDLDDRNVQGGRLSDVTLGLNWYLFPNARIMLNYIHADLSDREAPAFDVSGTGDIVQTRFQVDF